jgi:hypothetical protein
MNKKIFLHIGLHKTGSTTIQHGLHKNSNLLLRHGYNVPTTGVTIHGNAGQHNVVWEELGDKRFIESAGTMRDLIAEIEHSKEETIILSSEEFCLLRPPQINSVYEKLSPYGEIFVVVYLRRQDTWMLSVWAELVKQGFVILSFLEWAKKNMHFGDFYNRLEPWDRIVGQQKMRVRTLDREYLSDHVFIDFLKTCDINDIDGIKIPESMNISPSVKTLEIIRHIVGILGESPRPPYSSDNLSFQVSKMIRKFARESGWDNQKYSLLDEEQASTLLEAFNTSNSKVASKYLSRERLFTESFDEKPQFLLSDFEGEEALKLMAHVFPRLMNTTSTKLSIGKKRKNGN